jgi:hypothetical protein
MLYTAVDNFYLSRDELDCSPSHRAGLDAEVIAQLRAYGCELIQEGGILLKLPQVVMATGQVLFHRFYCKVSMTEYDVKVRPPRARPAGHLPAPCASQPRVPQDVATTCCWLASKLEEVKRRVRDILSVFHRMSRRREGGSLDPLDVFSKARRLPLRGSRRSDLCPASPAGLRAAPARARKAHERRVSPARPARPGRRARACATSARCLLVGSDRV